MRPIPPPIAAALLAATLTLPAGAAPADPPPVRLVPHRAVYDLSLASSSGPRGVESARGRIAFDQTGNACEGYALTFRQVTVLQSAETGPRTTDLRSAHFESGDGTSFRFRNETAAGSGPKRIVDGEAERKGGALEVRLRSPKRERARIDGAAVFPNAQMRALIVAAREGRTTMPLRVFDGSEDGKTVYETLAVIGARIEPDEAGRPPEEAVRSTALARMPRWPVTLSYFKPGRAEQVPVYVLGFELYDNGVSRALKLDYGDFSLRGELTTLEMLPDEGCRRP